MRNKLRKVKCLKKDLGSGRAVPGPCCFCFFNFFEVWLIFNVVLVSGVQQGDSDIYVCVFFSDSFPL